jgi:hypothetical protein
MRARTAPEPERISRRAFSLPGADDGIRTRDPHLGKVIRAEALTSAFL